MKNSYILEVSDLEKSFKDKKVVNNISFKVNRGDVFGFLGPNGAGKTTTIRMIMGLVHPCKGSIQIDGYDVDENFMNAIKNVGAVVESPKFYTYLSGYENLNIIRKLHQDIPRERIEDVLEQVGLKKRAKDKVSTYSLGMKQRLGIARSLINRPKLIILDEPTNGLDPQGMKAVREMIVQLAIEQDITFFISTHLLNEVEQICNKVAILSQGEIKTNGLVRDLLDRNNDVVEVFTNQKEEVKSYLEIIDYAKCLESTRDGVKVKLEKGYSNQLIQFLINKDVEIKYVVPRNQSLEEFFIEITKGGEGVV